MVKEILLSLPQSLLFLMRVFLSLSTSYFLLPYFFKVTLLFNSVTLYHLQHSIACTNKMKIGKEAWFVESIYVRLIHDISGYILFIFTVYMNLRFTLCYCAEHIVLHTHTQSIFIHTHIPTHYLCSEYTYAVCMKITSYSVDMIYACMQSVQEYACRQLPTTLYLQNAYLMYKLRACTQCHVNMR